MADPDRVTGFLEPGQNFQIWMKMDKNLIFREVFLTQNPVNILFRSTTEDGSLHKKLENSFDTDLIL